MQLIDLFEMAAAKLYHSTSYFNAVHILREDVFRAKTKHTFPDIGPVMGVSLTRNRRFALNWSLVTFEFDRDRLAQHYRLVQFNYWHAGERSRSDAREEAEEFVIGSIAPASRYITAIHISARRLEDLKMYGPKEDFYDFLRSHPLLQVYSP